MIQGTQIEAKDSSADANQGEPAAHRCLSRPKVFRIFSVFVVLTLCGSSGNFHLSVTLELVMNSFLFLCLLLEVIDAIPATRERGLCKPWHVWGSQASWGGDTEEKEEKERKGTSTEGKWEKRTLFPFTLVLPHGTRLSSWLASVKWKMGIGKRLVGEARTWEGASLVEGAEDIAHPDGTPGLSQWGKWQVAGGSALLQFSVFPSFLSLPPFLSFPPSPTAARFLLCLGLILSCKFNATTSGDYARFDLLPSHPWRRFLHFSFLRE